MMSTPVRCSSVRMLRPSRPMIRPFMSSDGSSTSETVVSAAWLAATRWSASATRLRARRRASDCASSSICRTRRASSWRTRSSERASTSAFASLTVIPETRSSSATSWSFAAFSSSWSWRACTSRSAIPCSRRSSSVTRRSSSVSLAGQPLLLAKRIRLAGRDVPVELLAQAHGLLLCLDLRLAPQRLGLALRLLEQKLARSAAPLRAATRRSGRASRGPALHRPPGR